MPANRFYLPQQLSTGQFVLIEGEEFHHLAKVMRVSVGDCLELVNGEGQLFAGHLHELQKRSAILKIESLIVEDRAGTQLILAQALPRLNRLEFIIEKCTELGMAELWLFPGERSERSELSSTQIQRLTNLAISALKQCGRLYLPKICLKPALIDWSNLPAPLFFGDLKAQAPLLMDAVASVGSAPQIIFSTGPEAGFSPNEIAQLKRIGGVGVKLHRHTLRTDTASMAALTLLSHRLSV